MNTRLKELRKELKLTQSEFGEKLGITAAAISDIEKGRRNLTDRNINLICEKFYVSEEWLREGSGDIFVPQLPEDEFSRLLSEIEEGNDDQLKTTIKMFVQLDEKGRKIVLDLITSLLENQKK